LDELIKTCERPRSEIFALVSKLEIRGIIKHIGQNIYIKTYLIGFAKFFLKLKRNLV